QCDSCVSFDKIASLNILELDAASNNSVEHIRTLIEQVRFQPQDGDYKVFIIDEVHMLSQQAFNAFLKTLEEPPSYAVFILATTEKHKIIPTILSRCQIFDFKRILTKDIVRQLELICKKEQINVDGEALHVIAAKADGALRDALSIFDKIISFGGKQISYQDAITNLNVLDYEYYFKVVYTLLEGDIAKLLNLFDQIQKLGFEGDIFINGLAEHFRNLLVTQHGSIHHLLDLSPALMEQYLAQGHVIDEAFILGCLAIVNECDVEYRMARNKRLHVEMALIKMNYLQYASPASQAGAAAEIGSMSALETVPKDQVSKRNTLSKQQIDGEVEASAMVTHPVEESIAKEGKQDIIPEAQTDSEIMASTPADPFSLTVKPSQKINMPAIGSLSAIVKEVEEKHEERLQQASKVIRLEEVEKIWLAYGEEQPSQTVKTVVNNTRLEVKNNAIVATVGSTISKSVILQETGLIERLREELSIPRLTIKIDIDETALTDIQKPKLLTTKEKYELLCTLNPHFKDFQEKFDLKIDHE
ncbi:MAG: DNA polymerase III subunit gamma/tau, partial [Saprospiraceae bacterium]|nr:DNA polymerase III subunit gamma/tau [Saprospiraceae bacterium]